jgi:DNA primase
MQAHDFIQKTFAEKIIQAEKITGLIAKIPDQFKQDLLLQQASSIMQLPFQSLQNLLLKQKQRFFFTNKNAPATEDLPSADQPSTEPFQPEPPVEITILEEKIFSAILNHAGKVSLNHELLPYFSPHIKELLTTYFSLTSKCANTSLQWQAFSNTLSTEDNAWVVKTCMKYADVVTVESFEQFIAHFYKAHWKNIVKNIKDEIQKARAENNINRLNELFGTFLKLKQVIQNRGLI